MRCEASAYAAFRVPGPAGPRHTRSMDFTPRALTSEERLVLGLLLSVDFDGVTELRDQAKDAKVTGRCDCGCPTVELAADPNASRSSLRWRLSPVEGRVAPTGAEPLGDIILFLEDGRLSRLEYVYYDDAVPDSWPTMEQVSLLTIER
jgi:hypothetical protein